MEEQKKKDTNIIFVGSKPVRNYAEACEIQFDKGNKEVILKTRGKYIVNAFNIAEFLKRKEKVSIKSISSGSEPFTTETKKEIFVSSVEIILIAK